MGAIVLMDHIGTTRKVTESDHQTCLHVELVMLYKSAGLIVLRSIVSYVPAREPALLNDRKVSIEKSENEPLLLERLWVVILG